MDNQQQPALRRRSGTIHLRNTISPRRVVNSSTNSARREGRRRDNARSNNRHRRSRSPRRSDRQSNRQFNRHQSSDRNRQVHVSRQRSNRSDRHVRRRSNSPRPQPRSNLRNNFFRRNHQDLRQVIGREPQRDRQNQMRPRQLSNRNKIRGMAFRNRRLQAQLQAVQVFQYPNHFLNVNNNPSLIWRNNMAHNLASGFHHGPYFSQGF